MSRNSAILERAGLGLPAQQAARKTFNVANSGEYVELIRRLFPAPAALAIVTCGAGQISVDVCEGIAKELAGSGRRVLVVAVDALLRMNSIPKPDETAYLPERVPNVWRWASTSDAQNECLNSYVPNGAVAWLDALRRSFDAVLLSCPTVETMGVADIAALADSAVLAVESGQARKRQLQRDQRALRLKGVRLKGCIMIRQR